MHEELVLVKPEICFEYDATRFKEECLELDGTIHGGGGMDICATYEEWLTFLEQKLRPETVTRNYIPSETWFAVQKNDDKIIGIVDIRKELNDKMQWNGGNIGLTIRPHMRGEGYGQLLLRKAIGRCKELGMDKILLVCGDDNRRAISVITDCGAKEEYNKGAAGEGFHRFWIMM